MDIEFKNVSKIYGGKRAVDNISLRIPSGKICGFIGLNGAGKTTAMKMMTNLIPVSSGEITFGGKQLNEYRERYKLFGAFISTPSYYGNLTAYENLASVQQVLKQPVSEADRVLELVGLTQAKRKRVSEFSYGMKQRLGLAFAFLNDPEILILDEPTNGLDPMGITEIREVLYEAVHDKGKTVFISSHNLPEMEQIADRMVIIDKGKIGFEGTKEELYNLKGMSYQIVTNNTLAMEGVLRKNEIVYRKQRDIFIVNISRERIPILMQEVFRQGIGVYEVSPNKNLESIFLGMTGGGQSC